MKPYFQSYHDYFWCWEDAGMVVAIPQASTIAYKDFLGDVIEKLSPQGLPPFGSLLLAIIATNPGGHSSLDVVYRIVTNALGTTDENDLTRAITFLKLLASLPPSFKEGPRRIMVFQVLFEHCHNILSSRNSEAALREYRNNVEIENSLSFDRYIFDRDFRPLSLLEQKFPDIDSILVRIAALPDIGQLNPDPEGITENNESIQTDLIEEIVRNDKTRSIGSLIQWLWSGLNIPVHSTLPSEQPFGGISDLTNRGDLDKLLISEFASDDLYFLSRLANHEALYVRREIPPAHNTCQRLILIDATLKSWGTPRVISFAIMLAITKHPKTDIPGSAFILGNEEYFPISTGSIEDIIDAQRILEGNLHPGKSLEAFLKDYAGNNAKEIFLLTEKSTYTQPGLQKVINDHRGKINYVILTDESGNVDVLKKERVSTRQAQHIKVPLDKLWPEGKANVNNGHSVAKFNVDYPILLRSDRRITRFLSAPDGEIFQCTTENSVLRLFDVSNHGRRGWDLVCRDLPYTSVAEIGMNDSAEYILLLFNPDRREITLLNLQTGQRTSFNFAEWNASSDLPSFVFNSGNFYHSNNNGQWRISPLGEVSKVEMIDHTKFEAHRKITTAASLKYTSNHGVFKNITKIFINALDELVFNIHALKLSEDAKELKLEPASNVTVKLSATSSDEQIFSFDDGSSVEVNRNGLLILRSSDRMVPSIFLPTALNSSLGVATSDEFAGNKYYYKSAMSTIPVSQFFHKHVSRYLNTIVNHGVKDHRK